MQRPDVCTQRVKAMCSDTCWYFVTSTALRNSKIQEQFWPQRYPKKIWPWAPLGFLLGNSCQPWRLPMKHPILRRLMHSTGGCASRNGGCWACAEGGRWGGGVTFLVGSKQSEPPPKDRDWTRKHGSSTLSDSTSVMLRDKFGRVKNYCPMFLIREVCLWFVTTRQGLIFRASSAGRHGAWHCGWGPSCRWVPEKWCV